MLIKRVLHQRRSWAHSRRRQSLALIIHRKLLSNSPPAATARAEENHERVLEWLASSAAHTQPPPPITHAFTLLWKQGQLHLQTCHSPIPHPVSTLTKLLTPLSSSLLLRSPPTLPPLHIEYSSPNIAKPLHMGHLRSTITGNFIRNVASYAGHDTTSVCFLGDWGRQFGVLQAGVEAEAAGQDSLNLQQLLAIYVRSMARIETDPEFKANAMRYSSLLESGDERCKAFWRHVRNLTVDHLKQTYDKLGITFDTFEGESDFQRDSEPASRALELLSSLNLLDRQPDGSLRISLGPTNSQILLKRDNSSVYLLRDIACAMNRSAKSKTSTRFVYVVDNAQSFHFQNLFKTLDLMGLRTNSSTSSDDTTQQLPPFTQSHTHVGFGRVTGMSTRSGTFVLISEVIDTGTALMHEARRRSRNARNTDDLAVSEKLAISGLVISSLKVRRNKDYAFDWEDALRSKGNTGVALQYGLARLASLLDKTRASAGEHDHHHQCDISQHVETLIAHGFGPLLVSLANFEDTFWRSYVHLEPCTLVAYAFSLNDKISKSLGAVNVLNQPDLKLRAALTWVYAVSRTVLDDCMRIVGVPRLDGGF